MEVLSSAGKHTLLHGTNKDGGLDYTSVRAKVGGEW